MDDDSDLSPVISTQKRNHCTPASSLPKVKKTRQRSLDSTYTQNVIAKAEKMNHFTNVVQCQRSNSQITFAIQCKGQIFNVQIGTNFLCSCSSSTVANRKTCCHIVWVIHYVFSIEKSNSVLAQIEICREIFDEMRESLPYMNFQNQLPNAKMVERFLQN